MRLVEAHLFFGWTDKQVIATIDYVALTVVTSGISFSNWILKILYRESCYVAAWMSSTQNLPHTNTMLASDMQGVTVSSDLKEPFCDHSVLGL